MKLEKLPPRVVDWSHASKETILSNDGLAKAHTAKFGTTRLRVVEYSAGFLADHWCEKGHVIFVISGALTIEHRGKESQDLRGNMSYCLSDDADSPHRVRSERGATVFIVD